MIKLTVHSKSKSTSVVFDKQTVIIGKGLSNTVDLPLPNENIQDIHLKILEQNNRFIALNYANDPFATLNDLPFGKKNLKNHDCLQIGEISINFEGSSGTAVVQESPLPAPSIEESVHASPMPEAALQKPDELSSNEPSPIEQQHPTISSAVSFDIDALFREVENLSNDVFPDPSSKEHHPTLSLKTETLSIEPYSPSKKAVEMATILTSTVENPFDNETSDQDDEVLQSFDSESFLMGSDQTLMVKPPPIHPSPSIPTSQHKTYQCSLVEIEETGEPDQSKESQKELENEGDAPFHQKHHNKSSPQGTTRLWNWNRIVLILCMSFVLFAGFVFFVYLTIREKSIEDKITAAEGVADVSMALAYAQVNHIKPQKQNWFDPEFLKNNLASVVTSDYPSLAHIDNQGHFNNCPYILRIYTSSDLDHFVILAQPSPNILQWLIPNPTIMVDSRAMELRETNDLRSLNRLLVNPNTLNSANALEISALVKQGKIIPLSTLVNQTTNQEFAPPKALGLIRPHAENYIYNAPRYYQFGESLMQKAITLSKKTGNHHEILRLQQEMTEISKFPDIILYSSQGLGEAIEGQKALAIMAPQSKFLTAYLHFNADGSVTSSHLLLNGSYSSFNPAPIESPLNKIADNDGEDQAKSPAIPNAISTVQLEEKIDPFLPLFIELSAIATTREQALKAISDQISALFNAHNASPILEYKNQTLLLIEHYVKEDREQSQKITTRLSHLFQEYSDIPLNQFKVYLQAAGLESFAHEQTLTLADQKIGDLPIESDIISLMHQIQFVNNFDELDQVVDVVTNHLTSTSVLSAEQLALLDNKLSADTLDKLGQFIISPDTLLPLSQFNVDNRATLIHVLKEARISEEDSDYYLQQFDLLASIQQEYVDAGS